MPAAVVLVENGVAMFMSPKLSTYICATSTSLYRNTCLMLGLSEQAGTLSQTMAELTNVKMLALGTWVY